MNPSKLLFLIFALFFHIRVTQGLTISGYGIKDLECNDRVGFQNEADWWNLTRGVSSAKITQTTSTLKWILGGPNILTHMTMLSMPFPAFERTYTNLPPHSFVGISLEFWYFDKTRGTGNFSGFTLQANGMGSSITGPQLRLDTDFLANDGGLTSHYDLGRVHTKLAFLSSISELTLQILAADNSGAFFQSFGFRELHIHLSNYSGSVPDMCHISEDVNPLQWNQCSCSINQAKDSSGSCVSCAMNCDVCFGPAANQCLACSSGAYWDGSKCNTCNLMCQTCTGTTSTECPTCKYGFYNYRNNTCMASCELPFVTEQIGIDLFCIPKCTTSQFYLPLNSSCLDKCDFPLIHAPDENGIEYCLNPCEGTGKYLYANGSCYDGCKTPLVSRYDSSIRYCNNPCPPTSYLFSNGSCGVTCPSPFVVRSEPGTNYCQNPCPSISYFLYNNGSCYTTCPAPLISRSEPGVKYCYTPCSSVNDFIYDNRSCGTSCSQPLASRTEPMIARYCLNPCLSTSNYFLYPNGSCLASCNSPLLNRTEPGVKYCYSSCSGFIYQNGTCENKCPFPLRSRSEPSFKYCFTPCPLTKYLYSDQSCHSSCDFPLVKRFESGGEIKYCNTPCNQEEYVYPDGSCRSECEYPYKILSNPSYKVCSMNLDEIQVGQAHSLARATDIANTICGIGGLLTGFITPGDPTSMLMWSLLKMLQFTKYMDVNFPGQMTIIFTQQNENYNGDGYMSSIGGGGRVLSAQRKDLGKFSSYGIPYGFLENYWQQLIVFGVLIFLAFVSTFLQRFLKNPNSIKVLKNLKTTLQWNIVLMFFCGSYGDLILYSAVEFQTASFENLGSMMSFLICLFMVILAVYIPVKILYVTSILRKSGVEKQWQHNRVFFEAYKSGEAIQHTFLFIYLIRVAFFNIVIGYIFKSPLAQAILINFMSLGMLLYLLVKDPLKERFCFYQKVLMESMLFAYNLCLLILVIMDLVEVKADSTRAFFGGIMVVILIVGPVGMVVLILLKLFLKSRDLYQQFRVKKESEKLRSGAFRFKKVRARGNFVIGNDETLNNDTMNMNFETINNSFNEAAKADDSRLVVIPPQMVDGRGEEVSPIKGRLKNKLETHLNLEKNIENLIVQIFAKKESNLKRRKINVFRNDDYLPD